MNHRLDLAIVIPNPSFSSHRIDEQQEIIRHAKDDDDDDDDDDDIRLVDDSNKKNIIILTTPNGVIKTVLETVVPIVLDRHHHSPSITKKTKKKLTTTTTRRPSDDDDTSKTKRCRRRRPTSVISLIINPALAEFLIQSSLLERDENVDDEKHAEPFENKGNDDEEEDEEIMAMIRSPSDGSLHFFNIEGTTTTTVVEINDSKCSTSNETKKTTPRITLRCLYDESGSFERRRQMERDGVCGVDDDDGSRIAMLRERLEGRLIIPGGVIGVEIPHGAIDDDVDGGYWSSNVAIFVVVDISCEEMIPEGKDDDDDDGRHMKECCYRLGRSDSFSVEIQFIEDDDDDDGDYDGSIIGDDDDGRSGDDNDDVTSAMACCVGYESVFDELLFLARLDDSRAPSAVLLTGCAGVGKTYMASCLSRHLKKTIKDRPSTTSSLHIQNVSARDIVLQAVSSNESSPSSLSEHVLSRKIIQQQHLTTNPPPSSPSHHHILLIIDDIDVLFDSSSSTDDDETIPYDDERSTALHAINHVIDTLTKSPQRHYFILGLCRSTSSSSVPRDLVRVGRFEKVVAMPPPNQRQRERLLGRFLTHLLPRDDDATTDVIASRWCRALAPCTAGCVASDLKRMVDDAHVLAMSRRRYGGQFNLSDESTRDDDGSSLSTSSSYMGVTWSDVKEAARRCIPSNLSSLDVSTSHLPTTTDDGDVVNSDDGFESSWEDFGGYREMKQRLRRTVVRPWKRYLDKSNETIIDTTNNRRTTMDVTPPAGVLFHGPTGCGKTFAATCLASCLSFRIITVRASDVLSKWLGSSESNIRDLFAKARAASPCLLFFDDIDALATNRAASDDGGADTVHSRVLSTLLNEMDGISSKRDVLVVGTTNRLDSIDAALLRPGRLEEHVFVGLPALDDVLDIWRKKTKSWPWGRDDASRDDDIVFCRMLVGKSAAEIEGVCKEVLMNAIRKGDDFVRLTTDEFEQMLHK